MEIILDLTRHCIETASKKKYEGLIRQYFKTNKKGKINIESQICALKYFLEKADFSELRNHFSNSNSVKKKAVLIIPQLFKNIHIRFNNAIFYPTLKSK